MKRIFITIYIILVIGFISILFGVEPVMEIFFQRESYEADRDLVKGTFYLMMEKFTGKDEDGQIKEIKTLQPEFGYPLRLFKIDDLDLGEVKKRRLINGEIVWKDNKDMVFQRVPNSDLVLSIGGSWPEDNLDTTFFTLGFLFLTGPAFIWTCFLNRDIKKIEKATERFSVGDHSTRVKISGISSMAIIAKAFNAMAEKTQILITSQKELSNSVSHEIRTPLSRIKFRLEMLREYMPCERQGGEYISGIGKDVEEIESLVNEILTYAKFERGPDSTATLPEGEMVSWLNNIISLEVTGHTDKRIDFITCPETGRYIMRFDPVYLGWAVRNLIRNALKYAAYQVSVIFETGKDMCIIHVDDDGDGISDSERERVFEPFFRVDKSRSKTTGGYGLGLAIAERIAGWHKGSISVETSPLGGARFSIHLPVK